MEYSIKWKSTVWRCPVGVQCRRHEEEGVRWFRPKVSCLSHASPRLSLGYKKYEENSEENVDERALEKMRTHELKLQSNIQVYLNEVKLSAIHSVQFVCVSVVYGITHTKMGSPEPKNRVPRVLSNSNLGGKKFSHTEIQIYCCYICSAPSLSKCVLVAVWKPNKM